MKVVSEAEIRPISRKKLQIGDDVLYSNLRCRVTQKPVFHTEDITFVYVHDEKMIFHGNYQCWYRMKQCKEINICELCGKEIPDGNIFCIRCEKELKKYKEYQDETKSL